MLLVDTLTAIGLLLALTADLAGALVAVVAAQYLKEDG